MTKNGTVLLAAMAGAWALGAWAIPSQAAADQATCRERVYNECRVNNSHQECVQRAHEVCDNRGGGKGNGGNGGGGGGGKGNGNGGGGKSHESGRAR